MFGLIFPWHAGLEIESPRGVIVEIVARRTAQLLACAAALAVAGCSMKPHRPATTVTVTAHSTNPSGASTTSSPPSAATTSPVAIPTARLTKLPGKCDDRLPLSAVQDALGHSVKGATAFVVGVAEKDIGRIGYLNCRYGLPAGAAAAKATATVEIGVSLYGTSAQAARRIPATVNDYTNHNATATQTAIGDITATILTNGLGAGYTAPTIVAAAGQRTIAIGIAAGATTNPARDLAALATLALQNTG
ncbi:MAG: hypothetical protein JWO57_3714 [Pseudonocardiales bacterium]|nr:hypothetical protein [Pseudonocardiales bacterium]